MTDIDTSGLPLNDDEARIVNSNGQRYIVGWDDHGYFTVVRAAEMFEGDADWARNPEAESLSFSPASADEVADLIKEVTR